MKAIARRVGRLEDRFQTQLSGKPKSNLRIIVARGESGAANLATSTCTRRLNKAGGLIETIDLDGCDAGISEEEMEQFIASFPIDPWTPAVARWTEPSLAVLSGSKRAPPPSRGSRSVAESV